MRWFIWHENINEVNCLYGRKRKWMFCKIVLQRKVLLIINN